MVFHWPPDAMGQMDLEELSDWRERARIRFEAQHGSGQDGGG